MNSKCTYLLKLTIVKITTMPAGNSHLPRISNLFASKQNTRMLLVNQAKLPGTCKQLAAYGLMVLISPIPPAPC